MDWDFKEESTDSLSFVLGALGFTFLLTGLILFSPGSLGRLLFVGCPITGEIKKKKRRQCYWLEKVYIVFLKKYLQVLFFLEKMHKT